MSGDHRDERRQNRDACGCAGVGAGTRPDHDRVNAGIGRDGIGLGVSAADGTCNHPAILSPLVGGCNGARGIDRQQNFLALPEDLARGITHDDGDDRAGHGDDGGFGERRALTVGDEYGVSVPRTAGSGDGEAIIPGDRIHNGGAIPPPLIGEIAS